MGTFLAVAAFRDAPVGQLVDAVEAYFDGCGVTTAAVPVGVDERRDSVVFHEPVGRWSLVRWPLVGYDEGAARSLSWSLDTVVSAMSIYDDDGWIHTLFRAGHEVDRFTNEPRIMLEEGDDHEAVAARWAGDPVAVASLFGVPVDGLVRHYRQVDPADAEELVWHDVGEHSRMTHGKLRHPVRARWRRLRRRLRGVPDPDDPWAFVALWADLGIEYPEPDHPVVARLQLAEDWMATLARG